jgi:hypothetical protein
MLWQVVKEWAHLCSIAEKMAQGAAQYAAEDPFGAATEAERWWTRVRWLRTRTFAAQTAARLEEWSSMIDAVEL